MMDLSNPMLLYKFLVDRATSLRPVLGVSQSPSLLYSVVAKHCQKSASDPKKPQELHVISQLLRT